MSQLELVCRSFPSLTVLDVSAGKPLDLLASKLTRHYTLTHLKVSAKTNYNSGSYTGDPFDFRSTLRVSSIQLVNIQILCLNFDLNPGTLFRIPLLFPAVHELELNCISLECDCNASFIPSDSEYEYEGYDSDSGEYVTHYYKKQHNIADPDEDTRYDGDEVFKLELFQTKVVSVLRQLPQLKKVYSFEFKLFFSC